MQMSEPAAPSNRRPTLKAVAQAAGVSTATASYVLSAKTRSSDGRSRYSSATAARVREAAQALNYTPNTAARAVRTGRTGLVQLSLSMLSDPWSLSMVHAVNKSTHAHGLLATVLADGDWMEMVRLQQADAVFIDKASPSEETAIEGAVELGARLIVLTDTLRPNGYDVVSEPVAEGCHLMLDYLSVRYDTIGCIAPSPLVDPTQRRLQPYLEMLQRTGRPLNDQWLRFYEHDAGSAYAEATTILSAPRRPRALYVTTDFAAIAAISAAERLGLRVPHDVAISGVGNVSEGSSLGPALTTVGPTDFFDSVAELIVSRALGADPSPSTHDFPWTLHVGDSA